MLKILIGLSISLCVTFASGQVIHGQEFNFDSPEGWFTGTDTDYAASISKGYYQLGHYKEKEEEYFWRDLYLEPAKDFYIETKITQMSGEQTHGYGLAFGGMDVKNNYIFIVSSSGQFKIFRYVKDVYEVVKDWTEVSGIVNPFGSPNVLGIRKSLNQLIFSINGTEVFHMPYRKFMGMKMGFFLYSKISIAVDYLKILQNHTILVATNASGAKFKKENLGAKVNTKYEEVIPVISSDGKTLYFDRKDSPDNTSGSKFDDIYYSTFKNNEWSKAVNIGKPLNNGGHNFVFSVSPDNNTLLLANTYKADGSIEGAGVSISHRTASGWELPQRLTIDDYYNNGKTVSFMLAGNRKSLLMSVKRDDTGGDHDLYVSFLKEDGSWSAPRSLGPVVNTLGDEQTPFLAADNATLYYSSNGRPGYGDNDIFVSRRLDESWTKWSEPLNMGPEINSSGWDAYYTVEASGNYAYFSSTDNSIGEDDIYRIRLTPEEKPNPVVVIYGTVYDKETGKPLDAGIVYTDLNLHQEAGQARSNYKDGNYKIILPYGAVYGFRADRNGYYPESDNISLVDVTGYAEIKRDLYLTPIKVGSRIKMNNIFFVQSKAALVPTSYPELDHLIKIMKDNADLKIDIAGHTDNVGDPAKNQKLSEERVQVIKDYLAKYGIASSRVTGKGYGGTKPIASNDKEETRKLNRRVEFTITHK